VDEALLPARLQFALQISFHILFPAITVALGWFLLLVKWRCRRTGDEAWMAVYRLWTKVFALAFALGMVSGIVMSFQFGANWPGFMERVGDVAGQLPAYEILTAFFLEATFLGVMLFGRRRVPEWAHTGTTALVAVGTTMSAFWILVLNSWMHAPAGFELRNGVVHAVDWRAIVLNPSMPYRLAHALLASALMVAFLMLGLSAWRWRRGDRRQDVWVSLRAAALAAAVLGPAQLVMGVCMGWARSSAGRRRSRRWRGSGRLSGEPVFASSRSWDANETWLVLGVGILLVAFPAAHGAVLTAVYLPVSLMLLALVFRGVAFEMRLKVGGAEGRRRWEGVFVVGSLGAALAQGWILGRYVMSFVPGRGEIAFAAVSALGVMSAYVLVGASWLVWRTEGALRRRRAGGSSSGGRRWCCP